MRMALAVALAVALVGSRLASAGAGGTMLITPSAVDTSSSKFEAEARKAAVKVLSAQNEQWTLHFIAFLSRAPGAPEVQLVFYDKAEKKHEPTNAFPITTKASVKVLVSNVSFGADQGFKSGHTYDVLVTRLVGGKESVFARSTITLK
jgi:hypothetical protein